MDGSAATSFAERTRSQISRAFANRTCNEVTAQSELFEQLLNLKFTVQPPPEKQPAPPDTPVSKSSSADDKKTGTKGDEEKDEAPAVTIATLTQAVPLVPDKPVELASEQAATDVVPEDAAPKTIELAGNQVDQQVTTTAADNQAFTNQTATVDDQVVVKDESTSDTKVDTTTVVSAQTTINSPTDVRKTADDSSDKKDVHAATKLDGNATTQPQGLEDTKPHETKENNTTNAQHEIAIKPKANPAHNEDGDDRRGDRREKWFEHKSEAGGESTFERPSDTSGVVSAKESSDSIVSQSNDASLQPAAPTAQPTSLTVDTSIPTPVALPVTVTLVPQAAPLAKSTQTTATSTSPETTNAVNAAPTRTVGHQTAKPNGKETISEPGLSQQERVRVIQRIARSFNRISAEGGSINLRLHPEHLGSVSVQVRLEGKSLSARLSTETTAARDAIMQDLPALRQRLADQGFDVTKFQVDVAGNGADASFAQSNGQSQFGQSDNRSSGAQPDYRRVAAMRESRVAIPRQLAPASNLNWQASSGIDLQA